MYNQQKRNIEPQQKTTKKPKATSHTATDRKHKHRKWNTIANQHQHVHHYEKNTCFEKYAPFFQSTRLFWKSNSPVCTLQRGIGVICNKCCATIHLSTKINGKSEPNCRHHAWQQAQQNMINTPDRHGWWEAPTQNCNTYIPKTHKQKIRKYTKRKHNT